MSKTVEVSWPTIIGLVISVFSLFASASFSYAAYSTKLDQAMSIQTQQAAEQKSLREGLHDLSIQVARLEEAIRINTEVQKKK